MDSKFSISKPRYFNVKKLILIGVIVINIIFLIISACYAEKLVEYGMKNSNIPKDKMEETKVKRFLGS